MFNKLYNLFAKSFRFMLYSLPIAIIAGYLFSIKIFGIIILSSLAISLLVNMMIVIVWLFLILLGMSSYKAFKESK